MSRKAITLGALALLVGVLASCGGAGIGGGSAGPSLVPPGKSLAGSRSGGQVFFTMMDAVARQPQLAGVHLVRTSAGVKDPRSAFWIDYRPRKWRSQTLPTHGTLLDARAFMHRCTGGTLYKYGVPGLAQRLTGPDDPSIGKWVVEERGYTGCKFGEVTAGNPPDGLLTGGLTTSQADNWIQAIATAKVKDSGKPLFVAGPVRTVKVAGKPVVAVDVTVNPSVDGTSHAFGLIGQALDDEGGKGIPYSLPSDMLDGFQATYWIDPTSHLPVKSVCHVVTSPADHRGGFPWRFQTTYQFGGHPDWNALPVK